MALGMKSSAGWKNLLGSRDDACAAVLDILCHRYVKEKQHAMRYRQQAERIPCPQFRETLMRMAAEEEKHADSVGAKIKNLGERLPEVIPIHVAREQNSWLYLRTDLEEEQRCIGELNDALPALSCEFPEIAELLERIDADGERHRAQLRDMLAHSDPQSAGPG